MRITDPSAEYPHTQEPAEVAPEQAVRSTICSCGLHMLWCKSGLTPEELVARVLEERTTDDAYRKEAFIVFSDVATKPGIFGGYRKKSPGELLYDYIVEKNLGMIWESGERRNPNSGNLIKVWVWEPPHKDLNFKYMPVKGKKLTMFRGEFGGYHSEDGPPPITINVG